MRIEAVNYHLWRKCNMRCAFCFAKYDSVLDANYTRGLPFSDAELVVKLLARFGFKKITFAGGEPTLCPWLDEIIQVASQAGMITVLVTNGSLLESRRVRALSKSLNWLVLSIDSAETRTNLVHGRAVAGRHVISVDRLVEIADVAREVGIKLRVNSVVTRVNVSENLGQTMERIKPDRWKIMRVLPIAGENDHIVDTLSVSTESFARFVDRNSRLDFRVTVVIEGNDDMLGSYVMVDPAGRFLENASGKYTASRKILDVGVELAIADMNYDVERFLARGGAYDW
ncbi:viperin family antiviral radical SAM protein [Candidatus Thiodictyon syntrophicum]|jgi:radical S-adenosyl methionine domain-containing protein 2|uniref:S-adenosylmethionine-dependent nucleotide dehydratase n=1 Tax=Candidatus Thiodictyon syntrophicum TaxID=1166950 RepID=A0A2K8UJG1_9GAMM|nr:viperin family antiviral radical SAM protein [Candidatus Thiodictyon syntrophicum]AUB85678.1 hypothetical protein THSYN_32830 [Candidatus Thiodictyon syntrophicum]